VGATTPSKDEWISSAEAAAILGLTPDTLRAYRSPSKMRSPPFVRRQGRVLYLKADVVAHLSRGEG
jgi:hypothetical protein